MSKKFLVKMAKVFLAISFISFFVACKSTDSSHTNALEKIKEKGVLRIGVFSDKPPFGFINKENQFDGFDIYIAKRFAKDLLGDEAKVEFIAVDASARVESLKTNKVDILMANFTKTPEREEVVDFAKPYMKVALGVVSLNGEIKDISQLKGKVLIVDRGTTADFYFTKNHPEIKLLKFEQNTEAFLAMKSKRGIALAHDNTLLFAWAKQNPSFKVGITTLGNEEVIAPAVKKGNTELLDWINQEIDTLTREGFMKKAYEETLMPFFGNAIKPESVIFSK